MTGRLQILGEFIRRHGPGLAAAVLVNIALPVMIYDALKHDLGDARALMASSAPPILWALGEFVSKRQVDVISVMSLSGIALSLLAFLGGGGARYLQLRENMVNVLIGAVFLGSAAIGKPLIYQFARADMARQNGADTAGFEAARDNPRFRRAMTLMTLVWGFGLAASALLSTALVFALSIERYLVVSPILGYGTFAVLGLWTFWFVRRQRRAAGRA